MTVDIYTQAWVNILKEDHKSDIKIHPVAKAVIKDCLKKG